MSDRDRMMLIYTQQSDLIVQVIHHLDCIYVTWSGSTRTRLWAIRELIRPIRFETQESKISTRYTQYVHRLILCNKTIIVVVTVKRCLIRCYRFFISHTRASIQSVVRWKVLRVGKFMTIHYDWRKILIRNDQLEFQL